MTSATIPNRSTAQSTGTSGFITELRQVFKHLLLCLVAFAHDRFQLRQLVYDVDLLLRYSSINVAGDVQVEAILLDLLKAHNSREPLLIPPGVKGPGYASDVFVGQVVLRLSLDQLLRAVDEEHLPLPRLGLR